MATSSATSSLLLSPALLRTVVVAPRGVKGARRGVSLRAACTCSRPVCRLRPGFERSLRARRRAGASAGRSSGYARRGIFAGSSESPSLSQDDHTHASRVEEARRDLVDVISVLGSMGKEIPYAERVRIHSAVRALEEDGGVPDPAGSPLIDGSWQLVHAIKPSSARQSSATMDASITFQNFRQTESDGARDPPIISVKVKLGAAVEIFEEANIRIENDKRISLSFFSWRVSLKLKTFEFVFSHPFILWMVADAAEGWLETTYLSPKGDLLIYRLNTGTIFILQQRISPRQQLFLSIRRKQGVQKTIMEKIVPLNPTKAPTKSKLLPGKWRQIWSSSEKSGKGGFCQQFFAGFAKETFQVIDADGSSLENLVTFCVPGIVFKIKGIVTGPPSDASMDVRIDSGSLCVGPIEIPLSIGSKDESGGHIHELFLDETLRISRGDEGRILVYVKESPSSSANDASPRVSPKRFSGWE